MKAPRATSTVLENRTFVLLLVAVTAAFGWILWPYFGAVLWAAILAVLFSPLNRYVERRIRGRSTLAALLTLLAILIIAILPSVLIAAMLLQQALGVYERVQSGEIDFTRYAQTLLDALPAWIGDALESLGLTSLAEVRERFSAGLSEAVKFIASQALTIGQNTLEFVVSFFIMLYLLFFLLRDGAALTARARDAIPLQKSLQRNLAVKFTTVIRAMVKGSVVVALVQGALGGLAFWLLGIAAPLVWGVVMAFLSLLPAIGTALVWVPVALYLLMTGEVWQGVALAAYGVLVIGLVDNVLRPVLVGKETRMPDYIVLLSTLGGITVLGFNGFVIGPIVAAMFIAVWDTVAAHRREADSSR